MRKYRVVLADTLDGLEAAAKDWTVLRDTIKKFRELESQDDQSLGNIGSLQVERQGYVCLAYRE